MSASPQQMPDDPRVIAAKEWRLQRWGWMESVRRDGDLSATARLVAHVLALDFVNVRTMRCDPSYAEIGGLIGASPQTVKRAISALVEAGWITRAGGIGRANKPSYGFLTRASVVYLKGVKNDPPKGVRNDTFYGSQKGSNLIGKGVKNDPAHNNAEPWKNHGAGGPARDQARARARDGRVSDNPMVVAEAKRAVDRWRDGATNAMSDLQLWVIDHILGAGLLTGEEIARVWPELSSETGENGDEQ